MSWWWWMPAKNTCRRFPNLSYCRVNFIFNDGIKHVENIQDHYDVIIVDSRTPCQSAF